MNYLVCSTSVKSIWDVFVCHSEDTTNSTFYSFYASEEKVGYIRLSCNDTLCIIWLQLESVSRDVNDLRYLTLYRGDSGKMFVTFADRVLLPSNIRVHHLNWQLEFFCDWSFFLTPFYGSQNRVDQHIRDYPSFFLEFWIRFRLVQWSLDIR